MKKIKLKTEERRSQIADATLRAVKSCGVGSLTTAAIAREAGISEANLYRHFKNKDEILFETVSRIGQVFASNIMNAFDGKRNSVEASKSLIKLNLTFIQNNIGVLRIIFSEEIHILNENIREFLFSRMSMMINKIAEIIKTDQTKGLIRGDLVPEATAAMIIGTMQGLVLRWSLSKFSFSLIDEGLKIFSNLEKCIKAEK